MGNDVPFAMKKFLVCSLHTNKARLLQQAITDLFGVIAIISTEPDEKENFVKVYLSSSPSVANAIVPFANGWLARDKQIS